MNLKMIGQASEKCPPGGSVVLLCGDVSIVIPLFVLFLILCRCTCAQVSVG